MKEESVIEKILRERLGIMDVINAEYPSSENLRNNPDAIVAVPLLWKYGIYREGDKPTTKREYDKMIDEVINMKLP
jgi:hypothetical protein